MKLFISLFLVLSVFSQTRKEINQAISLELEQYALSISSPNPDFALVYHSSASDQSQYGLREVLILNRINDNGTVEITRNNNPLDTSKIYNTIAINPNLTRCQSDQGTVTIQSDKLIVKTTSVPLVVLCQTADGSYREAYQTFRKN